MGNNHESLVYDLWAPPHWSNHLPFHLKSTINLKNCLRNLMFEILLPKVNDAAASVSILEAFWNGTADGFSYLGIMDTEALSGYKMRRCSTQ
jgi:hypothetical protein